jgi:hypothetical protein
LFLHRSNGYNKLVLAQHLDDLVESFLMSALHNGQVRVDPFSCDALVVLGWTAHFSLSSLPKGRDGQK